MGDPNDYRTFDASRSQTLQSCPGAGLGFAYEHTILAYRLEGARWVPASSEGAPEISWDVLILGRNEHFPAARIAASYFLACDEADPGTFEDEFPEARVVASIMGAQVTAPQPEVEAPVLLIVDPRPL